MANLSRTVTVTEVKRPARKLLFLRYKATSYFEACDEVGCEWETYFNTFSMKFETAACGRLPASLIQPDKGTDAFFVELPLSFDQPVPEGYEMATLEPCTYLFFQGMPFTDPNDFSTAIGIVNEAIESYPYERYGWSRSEIAPILGMGAEPETGACIAIPVQR